MGAIYEVIDIKTQRRRALKLMLPSIVTDEDMRARFKLEATVTANIESEHIVETFDADVDVDTGSPFLVMELLRGNDLADTLTERTRLSGPEVVQLLAQAARALDKTHAAGIVHRDLKPENLFITRRDDGSVRLKILDFGIAKVVAASEGQQKKQQTINLGTPPYMSPEQILGDATIDHRADLYALAHIAYALLVGEPYWLEESRNGDTLYRLLLRMVDGVKEPPTERAERYGVTLPQAFDGWFMRATAKNPGDRYNKASELVVGLADVLNVPLHQRPPTASLPDGAWEIASVMLPAGVAQSLISLPPEAALVSMQVHTPPNPIASALKPPSVSEMAAPAAESSAPVQSIPPLHSLPPANPTPLGTQVEVPPPVSTKPNRRAIWMLMAAALVLGFVGVLIVSGSPDGGKVVSPAASASASTSTVAASPPVADAIDAGTADAATEAPPVIAISASATSSASSSLPPSPSTGKTSPSATRKIPGPGPSTKTKHDPLKTL